MKFYITGANGFIGQAISKKLQQLGHSTIALGRNNNSWPVFDGDYNIINLAGSSIFRRFTKKAKQEIYDSRINTTRNLIEHIKNAQEKPQSFVSASAVGYYGDRKDQLLLEDAKPGTDFLAKVCIDWESTANNGCLELRVRCINIRTGHVLGNGGILKTLLPFFKLGIGGNLGSGKQFMPWVALEDIVELYIFSALNQNCTGQINAVAPQIITNQGFTKALGKILHRPTFFTIRKFALKLLYGEFGELMLYSQKASSNKAMGLSFKFKYSSLEECLKNNLL
jgi:uncharacterized protein (TIGR01777 family)